VRRARAAAALAGGGALLALALLEAGERPPRLAPPPAAAPAATPAATQLAAAASPLPALPPSLAGTQVDGDLRLDAEERFVPGPEALVLFDYFLAAAGEEAPEAIRARLLAELGRRLPPAAAAQAEALLDRYLAYRDAAARLFASDLAHADAERRFQRIRELRREVFGPGLAADLFGAEEAVLAVDLARRRVAAEAELAPEERARRLAALEAELPEAERRARAELRAALDLRAAEAELRAAGAGEAAIAAERERRFGPEAAGRLADLDRRRAAWDERVAAYRAERDALRARGLDRGREAEAIAALRAERFRGPERARVEALERIEARAAGAGSP
jgi:lipase chaperone LimK